MISLIKLFLLQPLLNYLTLEDQDTYTEQVLLTHIHLIHTKAQHGLEATHITSLNSNKIGKKMEFLTQTAFMFAILGYIYSIKDRKNKMIRVSFVLSLICLSTYIVAYLYLFFIGKLNWIKAIALLSVICCSLISIRHYICLG